MKENEVLDLIGKTMCLDKVEMDVEGQWDSLDLITILQALDDATGDKLTSVNDREFAVVKTPRNLIDLLKKHGIVE